MNYDEQEFQELLNAACDDKLTLAQSVRLEELLTTNPTALRRYDEYMQLDLEMHFLARTLPENMPQVSVRDHLEKRAIRPGRGGVSLLTLGYWRAHPARFAGLALVLTVFLWAGFYFYLLEHLSRGSGDPTPSTNIARISDSREVVWAEGVTAHGVESQLERGTELEITDGYLEVTFGKGAVVILEGPGKLVVSSPNSGELLSGRLVAHVEHHEARGFAVSTPIAQLIDYGTRFGVESSETRGTEVEVFEGIVDASPLAIGAGGQGSSLRLAAGQAASMPVGGTEFVRRPSYSQQFVQTLPAADAPLPVRLIIPQSVRASVKNELGYAPERLIDGSGLTLGTGSKLSHWGRDEGVCCAPGDQNCWVAPLQEDKPVQLTFDLGHGYELSGMRLWNYLDSDTQAGYVGAREIHLSLSSDGEHFQAAGVVWGPLAEGETADEHLMVIVGTGRYVRLELLNNHTLPDGAAAPPFVGLGEVRFEGKPARPAAAD